MLVKGAFEKKGEKGEKGEPTTGARNELSKTLPLLLFFIYRAEGKVLLMKTLLICGVLFSLYSVSLLLCPLLLLDNRGGEERREWRNEVFVRPLDIFFFFFFNFFFLIMGCVFAGLLAACFPRVPKIKT